MKKIILLLIIALAATAAFAGDWANGVYFAQEEAFSGSGWKYNVTLTVRNGRITEAVWNGTNIAGGPDKISVSEAGNYPMVARGGAQADWHVQAGKAEAYLLRTQDPTQIRYTSNEGHTDAISGVTIHVVEFFSLAEKALAAGPVARAPYRDGYYQAEEAQFSANSGWKYFAQFTVVNGSVVQVNWNGVHKDGGDTKKQVSAAGNYPMVANGGAMADWHVQGEKVEAFFLANGTSEPDAISGATISFGSLYSLANQALRRR